MNKKKVVLIVVILVVFSSLIIVRAKGEKQQLNEYTAVKEITAISNMENNYEQNIVVDFKNIALNFHQTITESEDIYFSAPSYNVEGKVFGLNSYVGKIPHGSSQEAITVIPSLLSAHKIGQDIDPYIDSALEFYNSKNEQGVVLNNPNGISGNTAWYETTPNIFYYWLYDETKNEKLEELLKEIAISFADTTRTLANDSDYINTDKYTAYNYKREQAVSNEKWIEPDQAAANALILYYSYLQTSDKEYLKLSKLNMNYLESIYYNPTYELSGYFSPYLAARINAEENTNYNTSKYMNWLFTIPSDVRFSWGMLRGNWSGYDIDGIVGSTSDFGGYGFAMNSYMMGISVLPVAKYDASYSDAVGKYMYNLTTSMRYFYPQHVDSSQQSETKDVYEKYLGVPYEGVKQNGLNEEFYATADAKEYGWAPTDLSVYSGAYAGLYASLIETNYDNGVIAFNLDAADFYSESSNDNLLLYNPTNTKQTVSLDQRINYYNIMKHEYIDGDITIEAGKSLLISSVENKKYLQDDGNKVYYNDVLISYMPEVVTINGLPENKYLTTGDILKINKTVNEKDIKQMTIQVDDYLLYQGDFLSEYQLDLTNIAPGKRYLQVKIATKDRAYRDTQVVNVLASEEEVIYELGNQKLQPISLMPGTYDGGKITENNPGTQWGGVKTKEIEIDLNKNYDLVIDTSEINGQWSLQVHVIDDPLNEYGYYLKADGRETGQQRINFNTALQKNPNFSQTGKITIEFWLVAAGREGSNFKVNNLKLLESKEDIYNKEQVSIDNLYRWGENNPSIWIEPESETIKLTKKSYNKTATYQSAIIKYDQTKQLVLKIDNPKDINYTIEVLNTTTNKICLLEKIDSCLNDGETFKLNIHLNSRINDYLIIEKFYFK